MITDEMVEKAMEAYVSAYPVGSVRDDMRDMRAALEAVAPMLIAQGMREAAEKVWHSEDRELILNRAQELDTK